MYTCNIAYTSLINLDESTPKLTHEQVWAGLKRKVKHADEFVPIIVGCEVLSEETLATGELLVTRTATFVDDETGKPGKSVKEFCTHYAPSRVDFKQEDGTIISNIISSCPVGNLMMTYSFQWRYPDIEEGSEEAKQIEEKHWKVARMAVHGSIDTIREMVKKGTIV